MSIHEDIVRIQMEHNCDPVEAFRLAWMKNIPRHLRRNGTQASKLNVQHQKEAGAKRSASARAEAAARRTALLAQIAEYLDQGVKSTDIAQKIGLSRRTVNRMASEIRPKEERLMPADTPSRTKP